MTHIATYCTSIFPESVIFLNEMKVQNKNTINLLICADDSTVTKEGNVK